MKWEVVSYGSGTVIVTSKEANEPWVYVYGPHTEGMTEGEYCGMRVKIAHDLMNHLNGGDEPDWLKSLVRWDEEHANRPDGLSISATGPMIDAHPPDLNWTNDMSDAAKNKRARLIDRIFGIGVKKHEGDLCTGG